METVSVRISKEVFRQLNNLAQEQLRTVPKTIEWLLREYKGRAKAEEEEEAEEAEEEAEDEEAEGSEEEEEETAQEYCEREPMKTRILEAMEEMQEGRNFKVYSDVKELLNDIRQNTISRGIEILEEKQQECVSKKFKNWLIRFLSIHLKELENQNH